MRLPLFFLTALLPMATLAQAPWGQADTKQGEALHQKWCSSCHAQRFGGDGSGIYVRKDRLIKNPQDLLQRVSTCSTAAKAGLSPAEQAAVAAWLDQRYYHFGQNSK